MTPAVRELNLDGLPGPTHNYAGLAPGNLASQSHKHHISNPRAAALQGLAKMKQLADLGVPQAVMPPQQRPRLDLLNRLGFTGTERDVLARAAREAPELLAACYSASSMWAANAATVCPSPDSADGRVHLTPANLVTQLHRSIEASGTATILARIFPDEQRFTHHASLPAAAHLRDEGAANHTRLCREYGEPGLHIFVYGLRAMAASAPAPRRHPARQSFEASASLARLHGIPSDRVIFAQQHPDAIDAGVFHNDVAAVGDRDVFFYHRDAFVEPDTFVDELRRRFATACESELTTIEVTGDQIPIDEAVRTYLFNSQLVRCTDGTRTIVMPQECEQSPAVRDYVASLTGPRGPFQHARFIDLRESMRNGGGPACLRLRVVVDEPELAAMHRGVRWCETLHQQLVAWVHRHYRDEIRPTDLADPHLAVEARTALDDLTALLDLPGLYAFQAA